jgi:hypothetical protein
MNKYLYRISTKQDSVWSRVKPKPIYIVSESPEQATKFANEHLEKGLMVAKVIRLAEAVAISVFTGI